MELSGKNIGVGSLFPFSEDLPNPGDQGGSPALRADSLQSEVTQGSPQVGEEMEKQVLVPNTTDSFPKF